MTILSLRGGRARLTTKQSRRMPRLPKLRAARDRHVASRRSAPRDDAKSGAPRSAASPGRARVGTTDQGATATRGDLTVLSLRGGRPRRTTKQSRRMPRLPKLRTARDRHVASRRSAPRDDAKSGGSRSAASPGRPRVGTTDPGPTATRGDLTVLSLRGGRPRRTTKQSRRMPRLAKRRAAWDRHVASRRSAPRDDAKSGGPRSDSEVNPVVPA